MSENILPNAARRLPHEIVETILLRLPIKSLLRFKSVSKSWNSMISDLGFIGKHYQLSRNSADSDNLLLRYSDYNGSVSLVRLKAQHCKIEARVWRPLRWGYDQFLVLCIGDGLILLHRSCDPRAYLLWNPAIGQETILRFPYDLNYASTMYGVCYDPINNDIKVVIASEHFYSVYSYKNRSWAEIKAFPYQISTQRLDVRRVVDGGLAVDGAIYWICGNKHSSSQLIVLFDSKDDSFKILQKPQILADDKNLHLKAMKSQLYLCCYVEDGRTIKIWVKEKGGCSWKFLVNIDNLNNEMFTPKVVAPLTENKMLISFGWSDYYIYNCCDKSYRDFVYNHDLRGRMDPFLTSMFSPVMERESRRKR